MGFFDKYLSNKIFQKPKIDNTTQIQEIKKEIIMKDTIFTPDPEIKKEIIIQKPEIKKDSVVNNEIPICEKCKRKMTLYREIDESKENKYTIGDRGIFYVFQCIGCETTKITFKPN